MSLIEGIGDEVTLVFGLVFLSLVVLFAWISTHTDDMSLFREVGVMVVELSQRRSRHRINRSEGGVNEQINPSGEGSNDSVSSSASSPAPADEQPAPESSESFPLSASSGASTNNVLSADQDVSDSLQRRQQNETIVSNTNQETSSDTSVTQEASQEDTSVITGGSLLQKPLDGEEIRQRRVQYFQGEGQTELQQQSRSNEMSYATGSDINSVNIQPQNSRQGECNDDHSATVQANMNSSSDKNNFTKAPNNVEEGQTSTSISEGTDSAFSAENRQEREASPIHLPNSQIRVKLRYLNETQRFVYAKPDDTIGDFRRTHFQTELEDNKWVRFIFNGQDLRDDARTLQACNVVHDSTMHCLVTSINRTQPQHETAVEEEDDSMLGTLMYPLFTILLAIVWYFRFTYRQYFSAMSTVCLIGISFTLALSYISSLRVSDTQQPQAQPSAQPSSRNANPRSSSGPRPN